MSRLICLWVLLAAVPITAGAQDAAIPVARISLPDPAYIGMPIWMQIESSNAHNIRYPSSTTPNDFYCNEIEVKQGARLLTPLKGVPLPRNGAACGFLGVEGIAVSKLPVHLQYQLTQAGTYLVRFTRREYRGAGKDRGCGTVGVDGAALAGRTAGNGRSMAEASTLLGTSCRCPLLGDALPSLLASRDNRVLSLMIETTYRGCPPRVWGCPESVLAGYAAESLKLFDPAQVRTQLLLAISQRGPSDALAYTLSPRDYAPIAPQIVSATLSKLHSSVPAEVEASVHTLYVFLRDAGHDLPRDTIARINGAMQEEVEFVISQKNDNAARWLAQFLAKVEPATGRPLLWKLVEAHLATEQSLICFDLVPRPVGSAPSGRDRKAEGPV